MPTKRQIKNLKKFRGVSRIGDFGYHAIRVLPRNIIVYKRVRDDLFGPVRYKTIKLMIPKGAVIHYSGNLDKARASEAIVLKGSGFSTRDAMYVVRYEPGKRVKPRRKFDMLVGNTCASGIHFYFSEDEANDHYRNV